MSTTIPNTVVQAAQHHGFFVSITVAGECLIHRSQSGYDAFKKAIYKGDATKCIQYLRPAGRRKHAANTNAGIAL